jgi:hypothetical protein
VLPGRGSASTAGLIPLIAGAWHGVTDYLELMVRILE